jgi:histone acetyltransferase (RNA polymerase elongator complex component)
MWAELKKPFIIPIFIPHAACPHRCVFCSQSQITGFSGPVPPREEIEKIIFSHLEHRPKNRATTQVSFFGGSFLGLLPVRIRSLIDIVQPFIVSGQIDAIRCSTRPDTITGEILDLIAQCPVSTIELGVQSMDDEVLKLSNRGHTARDTQHAVGLLKRKNYEIGIQMMVGLPGDTQDTAMSTARKIVDLTPDFVRIYPTIVLSDTLLAKWRNSGRYTPMPLDQCVSLVKKIYLLFRENNIPVIRMGLQPTPELQKQGVILDGPYHPSFGHLVYSEIFLDHMESVIAQKKIKTGDLVVHVHPKGESMLRGINNVNIRMLSQRHGFKRIDIVVDNRLARDTITINGDSRRIFF